MTQLDHKGYVGTAELSVEDQVFHGRLAYLRKGQFNVRTRPELRRAYARLASTRGRSLNEVVTAALEAALPKMKQGK